MAVAAAPRRLKVLVVAAAVHPDKGSEPGLGWGWVSNLARHHDLWVICGEKEGNREAIARELARRPDLPEHLRLQFIPRPAGGWAERANPLLYYRRYRKWHRRAYEAAQALHADVGFDLAHQLNMTGFREPGYLWKLDLPFVWGPVGGTANVPLRFASILGPGPFAYQLGKVTLNNLQLRFQPRVKAALRRADGFVTSTSDTRRAFLRVWGRDSVVIPDTGPPPAPTRHATRSGDGPLRLAWSGLHVSRKGLPLVLKALHRLPADLAWHLDIIGNGPMHRRWRALADSLALGQRCTWHGWRPRNEAQEIVGRADLFVFLSLHEGMPTVVMEAMALGVPVVCLDHCGQGDAVDDTCGVKIPVTTPEEVIARTASALGGLARDRQRLARLSRGCHRRLAAFSWEVKVARMAEVYAHALSQWQERGRPARP